MGTSPRPLAQFRLDISDIVFARARARRCGRRLSVDRVEQTRSDELLEGHHKMRTGLGLRTERFVAFIVGLSLALSFCLTVGFANPAQGQDNEAETDQRIVSLDATYDIDANGGKVDVAESITVANVKGSTRGRTTITRYFWTGQTVWVPTDAENLSIKSNGDDLEYSVEESVKEVGIDILSVQYPTNLNYGQTRVVDIAYSLPSYAPDDQDSKRRINAAYIDLSIIVCCNFENVQLLVTAPASFDLSSPRNLDFSKSTSEAGRQRYEFTESEETGQFTDLIFMDWSGSDENGLDRAKVESYPMIEVVSPPDDSQWSEDTSTLISDVMAELESLTGEDSPIQAASFQQTGDARFDEWGQSGPLTSVEIPRDFNETSIAATLARQWVATGPFSGDEINTGLAIDLGAEALRASGRRPASPGNPPTAQSFDDAQAFWFMREISNEIGHDALGATIGMARSNETAYVGSADAEPVATIENDWRRFLDLVERRGGATGAPELFEKYLLDDQEIGELRVRNESVARYEEIERRAGSVPLGIRTAMTNWNFSDADALMVEASSVLDERDLVIAKAEEQGEDTSVPLGQEWDNAQTVDDIQVARNNVADRDAELSGSLLGTVLLVGLGLLALIGLAVAGIFFGKKLTGRKTVDTIPTSAANSPPMAPSPEFPPTPPTPTSPLASGQVLPPESGAPWAATAPLPDAPDSMSETPTPAATTVPLSDETVPPTPATSSSQPGMPPALAADGAVTELSTPPSADPATPAAVAADPPMPDSSTSTASSPPMPQTPFGTPVPPESDMPGSNPKNAQPAMPPMPPAPPGSAPTGPFPTTGPLSVEATQVAPIEPVPGVDSPSTEANAIEVAGSQEEMKTLLPVTIGEDASSDDDVVGESKKPDGPAMPPSPPTTPQPEAATQPPAPSLDDLIDQDSKADMPDGAGTQINSAADVEKVEPRSPT